MGEERSPPVLRQEGNSKHGCSQEAEQEDVSEEAGQQVDGEVKKESRGFSCRLGSWRNGCGLASNDRRKKDQMNNCKNEL